MNLTFGSDPEFFASYEQDGKDFVCPPVHFKKYFNVLPVVDHFKHPEYIHVNNGVIIHQDGVAFEMKIPPVKKPIELFNYVQNSLDSLNDLVSKFGFNVYTKPTINFDINRWENEDEEFRECLIFGCDRDWDAFNYENYNSPEIDASFHPFRYGGGHLHISGEDFLGKYPLPAIQILACTVGNFVTANSYYPELDKQRVFLYGKPGKFRPQNYPDGSVGIEYRTPSNSWLTHLDLIEGVFHYATKAVEYLKNPKIGGKIINDFSENSIKAIMNYDLNLAKQNLSGLP